MYCYYYLHTNGNLIHKPAIVVDFDPQYFDSPFVKKFWCLDTTSRADLWTLLLESLALGADVGCVSELASKQKADKEDLFEAMARLKPAEDSRLRTGWTIFVEKVLGMTTEVLCQEFVEWGHKQDAAKGDPR